MRKIKGRGEGGNEKKGGGMRKKGGLRKRGICKKGEMVYTEKGSS